MWDCKKCGRKYNFDGKPCKDCGASSPSKQPKEQPAKEPPISTVQQTKPPAKTASPIKRRDKKAQQTTKQQPRKQRSRKIPVKRGKSTHDKPKDKQLKKTEPAKPPHTTTKTKRQVSSMASAKGKEKSGIDKQNTVDTHLPPIVFIQTRYCWLGYKQWGDTIGKYIPELERKVGQKPGGRGFKFGYQVLQKDEKKNPGRDPKNVDLDLTCFKCVAKPKPLAAKVAHTSSGESTDTKFGDFMELFCGEEGVLTKINGKLFSVTDANYAHNVAAAVACKTFGDNTKEGKKRLIVNFDQHEDFGFIKGGADILCSNWGGFCLRRDMKGYASGIADAYLVIGTGKTKEQCEHVFYEIARDGKTSKKTKQTGNKDIDTLKFIDSSQKENFWKDWCVFVTVDRDFFIGNGTEWGDGAFMPEDGRTRIEKILYHLKKNGASFVGFDVCGVPELAGSETDSSSKKRTTTAQKQGLGIDASGFRDRLATDIAFLWNLFKTLTR